MNCGYVKELMPLLPTERVYSTVVVVLGSSRTYNSVEAGKGAVVYSITTFYKV